MATTPNKQADATPSTLDEGKDLILNLERLWGQIGRVWYATRQVVRAEASLNLRTLTVLAALALGCFILVLSSWLGLNLMLVLGLIAAGLHWSLAGAIAILVNVLGCLLLIGGIRHLSNRLGWSHSIAAFKRRAAGESQ